MSTDPTPDELSAYHAQQRATDLGNRARAAERSAAGGADSMKFSPPPVAKDRPAARPTIGERIRRFFRIGTH
jgi:hypothetical protein